ncbi:MAG: nitrilase-related carbon-nitrogen hydrolase [Candidatus Hermodarchaeota archaeon]|nr:nitrilase-related carbon-nitrogen hydrolase [Candidatus Hermodarchaeota archaeon]
MRKVRIGLVQTRWEGKVTDEKTIRTNVEKMIQKHEAYTETAAKEGAHFLCFQELFFGPYFCAEQKARWYKFAEPIPGPISNRMSHLAKKHNIILIVPMYEEEMKGVYYNTAIVIDQNGQILGKYRKTHIPHLGPGFWEKFYFRPGNLGYPVFETMYGKIGVYICYDRHFPEGARALGLNGAEIVFNPSATVAGLSDHLWTIEQPAHAIANGYFIAAINRVGEGPWKTGTFYGSSYVANPRGEIVKQASADKDELLLIDIDLDMIEEVRNTWQFFRDRRPDLYKNLCET